MTAAQVLRAAAAIVRQGWAQGQMATWDGRFCAMGAIRHTRQDFTRRTQADMALRAEIGGDRSITLWNDRPGQTAEVVASTMERAAATLEREGK